MSEEMSSRFCQKHINLLFVQSAFRTIVSPCLSTRESSGGMFLSFLSQGLLGVRQSALTPPFLGASRRGSQGLRDR